MPPIPGGLRPATLRHFQSSPIVPFYHTSSEALDADLGSSQFASSFTQEPEDETDLRRQPHEARPAAYPDGPICIYDPHVDLYFEPSAQEAARYDVIFNVASEVLNPFVKAGSSDYTVTDLKAAIAALPSRRTCLSSTPPPPPCPRVGDIEALPEYIHVPWEHNTDIVPGTAEIPKLHDIIRIIDDRVSAGKRVLIHCQCGVSRSASLIVAYGLFRNPNITVQQAYDIVKDKSRWIGPNMSLIMQLQEYRNGLLLERMPKRTRSKVLHSRDVSDVVIGEESSIPQTAPLPQQESCKMPPVPIKVDGTGEVSAGPASAPSEFHWPSSIKAENLFPKNAIVPIYPETAIVNAAGKVGC